MPVFIQKPREITNKDIFDKLKISNYTDYDSHHKSAILKLIKKNNYTNEELYKWIDALPGSSSNRKPVKFKKGDVLLHPSFKHPYILLKNKKSGWVCTLITSEINCPEILVEVKSRFFPNSFVTKVIFTASEPIGTWMGTYDNKKQLRKIIKSLKKEI